MSVFRVILSIIFPPLAVVDKGCGSFLIVTILTLVGWVPGVIGALVILNKDSEVTRYNGPTYPTYPTTTSRSRCEY
jgi:uncharacterized membrane protein YqaE (UPF0057 family)